MEELLKDWGAVAGCFVIVGLVLEALKKTIGAKAGDQGFKGLWYVWKRAFILPFGAALGAAGAVIEVPSLFGDGLGAGVLTGVIGAALAALAYDQIVGSFKARIKHKLASD